MALRCLGHGFTTDSAAIAGPVNVLSCTVVSLLSGCCSSQQKDEHVLLGGTAGMTDPHSSSGNEDQFYGEPPSDYGGHYGSGGRPTAAGVQRCQRQESGGVVLPSFGSSFRRSIHAARSGRSGLAATTVFVGSSQPRSATAIRQHISGAPLSNLLVTGQPLHSAAGVRVSSSSGGAPPGLSRPTPAGDRALSVAGASVFQTAAAAAPVLLPSTAWRPQRRLPKLPWPAMVSLAAAAAATAAVCLQPHPMALLQQQLRLPTASVAAVSRLPPSAAVAVAQTPPLQLQLSTAVWQPSLMS
jgi:hypothetical protein